MLALQNRFGCTTRQRAPKARPTWTPLSRRIGRLAVACIVNGFVAICPKRSRTLFLSGCNSGFAKYYRTAEAVTCLEAAVRLVDQQAPGGERTCVQISAVSHVVAHPQYTLVSFHSARFSCLRGSGTKQVSPWADYWPISTGSVRSPATLELSCVTSASLTYRPGTKYDRAGPALVLRNTMR